MIPNHACYQITPYSDNPSPWNRTKLGKCRRIYSPPHIHSGLARVNSHQSTDNNTLPTYLSHSFHISKIIILSACSGARTHDLRLKRPLLYHLSYADAHMRLTGRCMSGGHALSADRSGAETEPAVYGLKARCHTTWLQTQDFMIFLFSLLFSFHRFSFPDRTKAFAFSPMP